MQTAKLDLRKEMKRFYTPGQDVEVVRIPKLRFVMFDGRGDPSSAGFQQAVQAVYGIAYTAKFTAKKTGQDFTVMPLEGLWWMKGGDFDPRRREEWLWTLMLMMPKSVTRSLFQGAVEEVMRKKGVAAEDARLEEFEEGTCLQTMHLGPYSQEGPAIARLEQYALGNGYRLTGKHHEIYLGDPRRGAPEKLKTIVRHPVSKA